MSYKMIRLLATIFSLVILPLPSMAMIFVRGGRGTYKFQPAMEVLVQSSSQVVRGRVTGVGEWDHDWQKLEFTIDETIKGVSSEKIQVYARWEGQPWDTGAELLLFIAPTDWSASSLDKDIDRLAVPLKLQVGPSNRQAIAYRPGSDPMTRSNLEVIHNREELLPAVRAAAHAQSRPVVDLDSQGVIITVDDKSEALAEKLAKSSHPEQRIDATTILKHLDSRSSQTLLLHLLDDSFELSIDSKESRPWSEYPVRKYAWDAIRSRGIAAHRPVIHFPADVYRRVPWTAWASIGMGFIALVFTLLNVRSNPHRASLVLRLTRTIAVAALVSAAVVAALWLRSSSRADHLISGAIEHVELLSAKGYLTVTRYPVWKGDSYYGLASFPVESDQWIWRPFRMEWDQPQSKWRGMYVESQLYGDSFTRARYQTWCSLTIPYWLIIAALMPFPILHLILVPPMKWIYGYRRRCLKCGYNLRASPGRCPECGTTDPVFDQIRRQQAEEASREAQDAELHRIKQEYYQQLAALLEAEHAKAGLPAEIHEHSSSPAS